MKPVSIMYIALSILLLFLLPASVSAGQPDIDKAAKKAFAIFIKKLDKDKDKKLNKNEFSKVEGIKDYSGMKYSDIDTNKDGFVTEAEYVVSVKKTFSRK